MGLGCPGLTLAVVVRKSFLSGSPNSPELSVDILLIPSGGSQGPLGARLVARAGLCLPKS